MEGLTALHALNVMARKGKALDLRRETHEPQSRMSIA